MTRRQRVAIESEHPIAKAGKVLPEDCVAPKLRHRGEHRQEAIREYLASEVDDNAELPTARGIEGRAELVLDEAEAGVAEEAEGGLDLGRMASGQSERAIPAIPTTWSRALSPQNRLRSEGRGT